MDPTNEEDTASYDWWAAAGTTQHNEMNGTPFWQFPQVIFLQERGSGTWTPVTAGGLLRREKHTDNGSPEVDYRFYILTAKPLYSNRTWRNCKAEEGLRNQMDAHSQCGLLPGHFPTGPIRHRHRRGQQQIGEVVLQSNLFGYVLIEIRNDITEDFLQQLIAASRLVIFCSPASDSGLQDIEDLREPLSNDYLDVHLWGREPLPIGTTGPQPEPRICLTDVVRTLDGRDTAFPMKDPTSKYILETPLRPEDCGSWIFEAEANPVGLVLGQMSLASGGEVTHWLCVLRFEKFVVTNIAMELNILVLELDDRDEQLDYDEEIFQRMCLDRSAYMSLPIRGHQRESAEEDDNSEEEDSEEESSEEEEACFHGR